MSRRPPLYTPEQARAEAEREGDQRKDDRGLAEGCGCCLVEGLLAFTSCVALVALPFTLLR